ISLTVFSVFDMLMMMLLYFSLKVAEVSLSKSSHLVPSWLTGYTNGIELATFTKVPLSSLDALLPEKFLTS
ncbi:hypothetical protein, partial [Candidatus Seongchinamella marina]|uniref:hypothetical protein n=1 Tax=Candidatus Seongchinamella marina TaxID=2518990 RepID=UPI00242D0C5B